MSHEIIPQILARRAGDEPIRVWSAGCASGEEAYSIAMSFAEIMGIENYRQRVKIYATDIDEEALNEARQGSYGAQAVQPVPEALRGKYFEKAGPRYTFRADMRRAIIFGRHNLVEDAPISRLDLLVCRNTLMYLNAETQTRILARMHFALCETGFLFLGRAEMLLTHANLFSPANLKYRIFTKVARPNLRDRLLTLAQSDDQEDGSRVASEVRLSELAFNAAPVAQMIVDVTGVLAHCNEQARVFFGVSPKDIGRLFRDLDVSYRPVELRSMVEQALATRQSLSMPAIERRMSNGDVQFLDLQVMPLHDNGGNALGVSIAFTDITLANRLEADLRHSKAELETASEELQSSNEELETTNEELQSTVEELETTNEELQSSNEEMETMNEELQSTNEELQTTNDELRQRTEELNRTNAYLGSILASLRGGVAVLNKNLEVTIWNRRAADLWGLREEEACGQSMMNLDIGLPVSQLRSPIRAILKGESDCQRAVLDATNRRGRKIQCAVTATPLVDAKKKISGVILLMEETGSPKSKKSG